MPSNIPSFAEAVTGFTQAQIEDALRKTNRDPLEFDIYPFHPDGPKLVNNRTRRGMSVNTLMLIAESAAQNKRKRAN